MGIGSPKSEGGKRDIPLNDTIKGVVRPGEKAGECLANEWQQNFHIHIWCNSS